MKVRCIYVAKIRGHTFCVWSFYIQVRIFISYDFIRALLTLIATGNED